MKLKLNKIKSKIRFCNRVVTMVFLLTLNFYMISLPVAKHQVKTAFCFDNVNVDKKLTKIMFCDA